ncbi:ABC transporter ATP-binding protein [Chlamydia pecorum]|uniref:Oligopeptide/dipeptide ABC transporter n=1 Tax=Chlamydia pecorum TaxID=85991 RepID=A0AA40PR65_9CHLA|nr:ABC transporter ATP-binding protein [Chlamydia pecorum]AGW37571.1 putative peptide ABC transport ATP-binding protein [Chlamydia pecorum PV3056/3]AGW38492.1 putative peptide ABC transport ATP-binding protein [Chlamydia pecorum W73]AGW39417.1 putative peptide ABC transport ATP-binding protein [Chlamydia pecorum P787]ETF39219.1 peptide ABC transporter ATPase [Chlamydia pecorum DBDeUG]ETF39894.1 peptide ABC transporter ATPase [Chlamydia pecorum MC/MarsBar]
MAQHPILQVENLTITLTKQRKRYTLVQSLSFELYEQQTLAIIGESGSGKTLTVHALLQLLPRPQFAVSGSIRFQGQELLSASKATLRKIIGTQIATIFQNPHASFNPVFTIEQQLQEIIRTHLHLSRDAERETLLQALYETGFHQPETCLKLYPHQLSGGMLQRVGIAMALLCSPKILIADEPTTALDVSIQYQILQLLKTLQEKTGMSLLMITHNMGVVAEIADHVLVLYGGCMAEKTSATELFHNPAHPYTQDLLKARPSVQGAVLRSFMSIPGHPPHYTALPSGCVYHPRCSRMVSSCQKQTPKESLIQEGHKVRCWLYD